jgi:hypothetical protein
LHIPARALLRLAALGLAATSACLPEVSPDWLLEAPRLILVEAEVIATGELSTPLADDPPGRRRREGLPGDRVRLRPIYFDAGGPFEPEVIVLLSTTFRDGLVGDTPIPLCEGEAAGEAPLCRLAGLELVLPPLGPADTIAARNAVYLIAGEPGVESAESCLTRVRAGEIRFGCLFAAHGLSYGPLDRVQALRGEEVTVPSGSPDLDVPSSRLELEISGAAGQRSIVAHHGDTVPVGAGDRVRASLVIDEEELQSYTRPGADGPIALNESSVAIWWSTLPVFELATDGTARGNGMSLSIPAEPAVFDVTLRIEERSGAMQWLWVRFESEEADAP